MARCCARLHFIGDIRRSIARYLALSRAVARDGVRQCVECLEHCFLSSLDLHNRYYSVPYCNTTLRFGHAGNGLHPQSLLLPTPLKHTSSKPRSAQTPLNTNDSIGGANIPSKQGLHRTDTVLKISGAPRRCAVRFGFLSYGLSSYRHILLDNLSYPRSWFTVSLRVS